MTAVATDPHATSSVDAIESAAKMDDGVELFYRAWLPARRAKHALLLFHRGHEHSGRFDDLVTGLALEDVAIFAWDARGHGRSPGQRGHAESFSQVVHDIDIFARHISSKYEIAINDMAVLGHSVGAVAVAAWVHDYAPPIRAMILATPAFRVKLYIPFAMFGLRLLNLLPGKHFIKSYVRARMLTHDLEQADRYSSDPLISRKIAVNILLDVFDMSSRLLKDAGAIVAPTMILSAGADWVVKNRPQQIFFERLSSPIKRMMQYDGFYHAILHEPHRDRPMADLREFLDEAFARDKPIPSLLDAHKHGFTRDEFDRLSFPPTIGRSVCFALQRLGMEGICRLSAGVRLGWRRGFDSGQSLDYIYENRPRGITPLGKLIDRLYLNAIGWRGIRQRKIHLQESLREAIERYRSEGRPVRLVDVASGPGRYALEVLQGYRDCVSAVLRDQSDDALTVGRKLAADSMFTNVTFETGDAFNESELASLTPAPNIVIVSGLYELFPDNELILRSLRGIAKCLAPGGRLIYTGQPWHPQIEMIARVLTNRDGKPWIMRRRPQVELDQLVASVGFEKIGMKIDRWGIFTVSTATRRAS